MFAAALPVVRSVIACCPFSQFPASAIELLRASDCYGAEILLRARRRGDAIPENFLFFRYSLQTGDRWRARVHPLP